MAKVAGDSANPDVSLLRGVNGLSGHAPRGVDRAVEWAGGYGLVALALVLVVLCWWRVARRAEDAPAAVAGVLWSALAAGIALLLDLPIRALVQRPRPYLDHDGLHVLVHEGGYSFVSVRSAVIAAVAVGLFTVSRRFGAVALLAALAEGFCDIYVGTHYPTDVIGGFALGTATALLLTAPAVALLTALTTRLARGRASALVRSPRTVPAAGRIGPREVRHSATDKDLAA
ncbi:undecaprenyl-diphosphatase [Actinacidiphila yanglinensis]|uniref:Undecaprenyl-diphosphatase n=1 Tax=Actinacidiphila yanglinensis TaxID=310779 RepID=A0A1H6DUB7_9ACTN|nr:phosphatase PAP2 family protein [Actinacidiphila yanglinensis]SEG88881.1 undecaprenyl-diphosphatase [Actinacidiphila yanglinensis]